MKQVGQEPADAGIEAARLGIVALERNDLTAAVGLLGLATLRRPEDADSHVALGIAHARRGEVLLAIEALERAVLLEPRNFLAQLELGELYRESSLASRSQSHLVAALSAARSADERSVVRRALDSLPHGSVAVAR